MLDPSSLAATVTPTLAQVNDTPDKEVVSEALAEVRTGTALTSSCPVSTHCVDTTAGQTRAHGDKIHRKVTWTSDVIDNEHMNKFRTDDEFWDPR